MCRGWDLGRSGPSRLCAKCYSCDVCVSCGHRPGPIDAPTTPPRRPEATSIFSGKFADRCHLRYPGEGLVVNTSTHQYLVSGTLVMPGFARGAAQDF